MVLSSCAVVVLLPAGAGLAAVLVGLSALGRPQPTGIGCASDLLCPRRLAPKACRQGNNSTLEIVCTWQSAKRHPKSRVLPRFLALLALCLT